MPRDEHDGKRGAALVQTLLQLQAAHPRHAYVEHEAAALGVVVDVEKGVRGRIGRDIESHRIDEVAQGIAHGIVVVDHEDGRGGGIAHTSDSVAFGRLKRKVTPRSGLRVNQNRPP